MEKKVVCCTRINYFCGAMRRVIDTLGIVPVTSSAIASLYPAIKAKGNKVADLERAGDIVRLKRGLYVARPEEGAERLSLGLIANHLYAPSYVSMYSALRYYGLIPESVYVMQSVTLKHSRDFDTPLGLFSYRCMPSATFSLGLTQAHEGTAVFVVATPEKALCDLVACMPRLNIRYQVEARRFLEEDLRLDMDAFSRFDPTILEEYAREGKKSSSVISILRLLANERTL